MAVGTRLCIVSPGRLGARGHRLQVDPKTASGLAEYAAGWPGEVVFVARRSPDLDPASQPFDWPEARELPVECVVVDDLDATVAHLAPAVVLAALEEENSGLLRGGVPVVWSCDFPVAVRWESARASPSRTALSLTRTAASLLRRSVRLRRLIRRGAGLQCNGPDTFAAYASYSADPLLYYDTRVRADAVQAALSEPPDEQPTLRLGFSGRWIPQKGVLDAVEAHRRLVASGLDCTLAVMGGGPLAERLAAVHTPGLVVMGRLDFDREWVPFVRSEVDLMVLPHLQGDSASTFLESMSCGTPVAGYSSRYWTKFRAQHGSGWEVRGLGALVELLAQLAASRSAIRSARAAGLEFAAQHSFEVEFHRRVTHLRKVGNL